MYIIKELIFSTCAHCSNTHIYKCTDHRAKLGDSIPPWPSGSAALYASTAKVLWIKQQKFCMAARKGYTTAGEGLLALLSLLIHIPSRPSLIPSSPSPAALFSVFLTQYHSSLSLFTLFSVSSLKLSSVLHNLTYIDPPPPPCPPCTLLVALHFSGCTFLFPSSPLLPLDTNSYYLLFLLNCLRFPLISQIAPRSPLPALPSVSSPHFFIKQTATLFSAGMSELEGARGPDNGSIHLPLCTNRGAALSSSPRPGWPDEPSVKLHGGGEGGVLGLIVHADEHPHDTLSISIAPGLASGRAHTHAHTCTHKQAACTQHSLSLFFFFLP